MTDIPWLTLPQAEFEEQYSTSSTPSRFFLNAALARALAPTLSRIPTRAELEEKPFLLELSLPLPKKLRFYAFAATQHASERQVGTFKIQLTSGIDAGGGGARRLRFDRSEGIRPILLGYVRDLHVFILWDADMHDSGPGYPFSKSVQAPPEVVWPAIANGMAEGTRRLRTDLGVETIISARQDRLVDAIVERISASTRSLIGRGE